MQAQTEEIQKWVGVQLTLDRSVDRIGEQGAHSGETPDDAIHRIERDFLDPYNPLLEDLYSQRLVAEEAIAALRFTIKERLDAARRAKLDQVEAGIQEIVSECRLEGEGHMTAHDRLMAEVESSPPNGGEEDGADWWKQPNEDRTSVGLLLQLDNLMREWERLSDED